MKSRRPAGRKGADEKPRQEAASELAIAALGFLADDPDALGRFLAISGLEAQSIRTAARERGFLLGVLDFLAGDEQLLLAFANQNDVDPEDVARAQIALAGKMPEEF
jgi:Protein of unknown function (DUF3572)